MPIHFHYDLDLRILFTRAEGRLTFDEIILHLNGERNAKGIAHPEITIGLGRIGPGDRGTRVGK